MPLIKFLTLALICLFAGMTIATPAKANINWSNPDNYRDIQKSAGESEQAFRKRIAYNISRTAKNEPLEIEKKMFTRWFKNTFK